MKPVWLMTREAEELGEALADAIAWVLLRGNSVSI